MAGAQSPIKGAPRRVEQVVKPSRDNQRPRHTHLDLHVQVFGKSEPPPSQSTSRQPRLTHEDLHNQALSQSKPTPVESESTRGRPRFTHEDLHNQVLTQSESPSRRELPKPPSNSPSVAAPTQPPVLRRPRSGTLSNRPPLPKPPGEVPASRPPLSRQLPPAPVEGSPQSRVYGLPATPSIRRASSFLRTTPTLPSVPEPGTSLSPGVSSASPRYAMTTSPLPVSPESAISPKPARHSIYGVTLRPVGQTSPSVTSPPGNLQRNRTLPPRPLPNRRDSVPVRSQSFQAAASSKPPTLYSFAYLLTCSVVFEAQEPPEQPLKLSMSSLSQFPAPPRPALPTIPSTVRPPANPNRPS